MNIACTYRNLGLLQQPQIDLLRSHDVSPQSMMHPECLRIARGFCCNTGYFDASENGELHIAFLARNRFGDEFDIAYWNPKTGKLASELNRAFALGEDQINDPWFSTHGGRLVVHSSPWEWLISGKQGIVIIRNDRAYDQLRDVSHIVVDDVRFGERLNEILQPPSMPNILVSIEEKAS